MKNRVRSGKEINLTICRKNRDLIFGPTAWSIPSVCNAPATRKAFTRTRQIVKAISERLLRGNDKMRRELNSNWGSGVQGETQSCSGVLREHSHVQRGPEAAHLGYLPPAARRSGTELGSGSDAERSMPRRYAAGRPRRRPPSGETGSDWGVTLRAISLFQWDGCANFSVFGRKLMGGSSTVNTLDYSISATVRTPVAPAGFPPARP